MSASFKGQDLRSRINQLRRQHKADPDSDEISLSSIESIREEKSPIRVRKRPKSRSRSPLRPRKERSKSPPQRVRQRSGSPEQKIKDKSAHRHRKKTKEKSKSRSKSKSKKSKKKSKKKKERTLDTSPVSAVSLSPERPPRRVLNDRHRPYRPRRSYPPRDRQSWEDKVSEFMNKISSKAVVEEPETEPPEEIKLTPLMKFVASALSTDKQTLILTGPFKYNILSLTSRSEWVAAKAVKLLEEAGHDTDWLYDTASIKGASGLKHDLIESLKKNKIVSDVSLRGQIVRVIKIVIKYFTDEDIEIEQEVEGEEGAGEVDVPPTRAGLGAVLDRLQASAPPPPPPSEQPAQEINHWTMLADNIQASSLSSFEKLENYLSQDLLRLSSNNKEQVKDLLKISNRPAKDAFEVARHMVMCWVNTGYSFPQLWSMVNQSNVEDILPPRDPNDTSGFNIIGPRNDKYLASKFLHQLKHLNKSMSEKQIDYVVWKTLLYVMRGCGKVVNNKGFNVSYNYLPPGLRELEAKKYSKETHQETFVPNPQDLSEDPLNIIIDPYGGIGVPKGSEIMPKRKYFIATVHLEWVMYKGKAEIYEISVYCQDMSKIELVVIPDALKVDHTSLEALGFTLNRNLNKYFYVQSGMGCVTALSLKKAVEKLVEFLDKKRIAGDENQNNGLVLLLKDKDHLASLCQVLQHSPELTIDTVKGFGLLDSVCSLADTQINLVGNECCLSAQVLKDTRSEGVLAKSKAELLFKALEVGLQVCNPGYDSFVQPYGFPSDGSRIKNIKLRAKELEQLYELELFVANELKHEQVETFLEGIYSVDKDQKDLRHKSDIVAHKFCQALVEANVNLESLQRGGKVLSPDIVLDQMDKPQRLKVLNQTRACTDFVYRYMLTRPQ